MIKTLQVGAVLLTAVGMSAGWAHLLELPNKIGLSREDYLTVQQIYRGWALLGIPIIGALIATSALAVLQRADRPAFYFALTAALAIALALILFFLFTFPMNQATENWTVLPEGWEAMRRQWEYSHAVNAIIYFVAMAALAASIAFGRR